MNGKFLRKNWKNYNQHNNNNIMPTLYLIPTTLGETALDTILPAQNDQIVISLKYFMLNEWTKENNYNYKKISILGNIEVEF